MSCRLCGFPDPDTHHLLYVNARGSLVSGPSGETLCCEECARAINRSGAPYVCIRGTRLGSDDHCAHVYLLAAGYVP